MKGRACAAGALGILACVALLHLATATPASNERSAPLLLRSPSPVAAAGATGLPACVRRYGLRQEAHAEGLAQGTTLSTNAMTKLRQRHQEDETEEEEEEEEEYCDSCAEQVGLCVALCLSVHDRKDGPVMCAIGCYPALTALTAPHVPATDLTLN